VLANPRAESLLNRELAAGAPMAPAGGEDLASRVRAFLESTDEDEEMDVVVGDRQIHVRLTRLPGAGKGTAVVTLDDVTELARAQRVLAWGEMARQVAHEIKNPLTPIRLGVQHLKRAHGDAHPDFERILEQNVSRILAEIDRLDEIARSFSRYGALPADRLRPVVTDVAAVARDVVELERLGKGGVDWQLEGADRPLAALARAEELREVLLNLLENARLAEATRIAMRLEGEDGLIVIEVRDDGRGIPAQILPRIFEPHFSTRTSGSGLGLAVSRQLVESWGGSIAITSNGGTLVRVELVRAG
jgi:two-component system, NtrC family, nitrogen regulation sensor histidine kinase NtrY